MIRPLFVYRWKLFLFFVYWIIVSNSLYTWHVDIIIVFSLCLRNVYSKFLVGTDCWTFQYMWTLLLATPPPKIESVWPTGLMWFQSWSWCVIDQQHQVIYCIPTPMLLTLQTFPFHFTELIMHACACLANPVWQQWLGQILNPCRGINCSILYIFGCN